MGHELWLIDSVGSTLVIDGESYRPYDMVRNVKPRYIMVYLEVMIFLECQIFIPPLYFYPSQGSNETVQDLRGPNPRDTATESTAHKLSF